MIYKLPVYKGYTVDYRLKEFRRAEYGKEMEFHTFDSEKGEELLTEMIVKDLVPQDVMIEIF